MAFISKAAWLAVAVILCPAGWCATRTNDAEYLGGTVKSIQPKTAGALDLDDSSDLQFKFATSTYRLPYSQIRSFHFSEASKPRPRLGLVPLPKLPFKSREQVLDLSFKDGGGDLGTVSFRLTGNHRSSTEWILSQRIEKDKKAGEHAEQMKHPEAWWGDKYWKTSRNKAVWLESRPESASAVASSK